MKFSLPKAAEHELNVFPLFPVGTIELCMFTTDSVILSLGPWTRLLNIHHLNRIWQVVMVTPVGLQINKEHMSTNNEPCSLGIYPSIYLSIYLSICPSIYLSIYLIFDLSMIFFLPQEIPFKAKEQQDGYVLLLVILSIFLVGTLIFISVLLIACRRCCRGGQCCDRCDSEIMYYI